MSKTKFNNSLRPNDRQYRIGFSDLSMDSLWDPEAEKYKALCRTVHVTNAARHIGYIQWAISTVIFSFFFYHYVILLTGNVPTDHWIQQYTLKYISQLLLAITLQLLIVGVLLYGIRSENRSFLLPYIIYASIALLAGCAQLGSDVMNMDNHSGNHLEFNPGSGSIEIKKSPTTQTMFFSHLIGTLIHAWCLSVVWRCYCYYGDKKVAFRIGEQLRATQAAFQYPDQLLAGGYMPMQQPPPYADTVLSPNAAMPLSLPIVRGASSYDKKKSATGGSTSAKAPIVVDAAPLIDQPKNDSVNIV